MATLGWRFCGALFRLASVAAILLGARAAWAADPTVLHCGSGATAIDVTVKVGEWGADPTLGEFHGKGTVVFRLGKTLATLDAHWTHLAVDLSDGKVTAGTIVVDLPPGGVVAAIGMDVKITGLEIAPDVARVTAGTLSVPATTASSWGCDLASLDLAGAEMRGASGGELAGGLTRTGASITTFDLLGLRVEPGATAQIDLSATQSLPTTAIPATVTGGADAWTGVYVATATARPTTGGSGVGAKLADVAIVLDVGAAKARVTGTLSPSKSAPYVFKLSGLETSLDAGTIALDSDATAKLVGSASGSLAQGGGTAKSVSASFGPGGTDGIDVAIKPATDDTTKWLETTTTLPVRVGSLHVKGTDAATGTLTKATLNLPSSVLGIGLTLPSLLDLAGTPVFASTMGLAYLEVPISGPVGFAGLSMGPKATLRLDLSDSENAPIDKIPPAHTGGAGVEWRGFDLTATNVAIGKSDPSKGAPLAYLCVGWPSGSVSGAPQFRGEVKPTPTNPLGGDVMGVGLLLTAGTLTFDSAAPAKVSGTFDGTLTLPGSDGDAAAISGLAIAYGPDEGFQFVVEHVKPKKPLGFGLGEWGAHVDDVGVDASTKKAFLAAPKGAEKPEWTGMVVYAGDLSLPLGGIGDSNALPLAITDFLLPFKSPGEFGGWLKLKSEQPIGLLSVAGAKLKVVSTRPSTVPAIPAEPGSTAEADLTSFHFEKGSLVGGRLFGMLTVPGVKEPIGIGAKVDKDGGLVAEFTLKVIEWGDFRFTDIDAVLDLSSTESPKVVGIAEPAPAWTGLMLKTLRARLPWPFESEKGGETTVDAKGFLWDQGLTGKIELATTEVSGVRIKGAARLDARLKSFELRFLHGDLESLKSVGTLNAKPFVNDPLKFTVAYDPLKGFLLQADIPKGDQAFGVGGLVTFGLTTLAIELPGKEATGKAALPALRMDGAVSVKVGGVASPAFKFEGVRLRSDGTLNPGGGWIDLREYGHWDFNQFGVDVREIGFGSMPGGERWFGLSGGIRVSEALGMDVSVQANKFRWFEGGSFTVDEVALKASVKKVFALDGKVKFVESDTEKEFRGSIKLGVELVAGGAFEAKIQFVAGHASGFEYWGVSGDFALPAPVALGATGFSLYGVNGGCSHHLRPTGKYIYDWPPDVKFPFAFQAGVTVGTTAGDGFLFHAGVTLTVSVDPLVVRLDGEGRLLTARDSLNMDRVLKAVIVFDASGPSFDASLTLGAGDGRPFQITSLVELRGTAALHVGPDGAFFHIGTKEAPITARVFPDVGGITASSWFSVDLPAGGAIAISVGAYATWSFCYDLGICDVSGHLSSGGELTVTFGPFTFHGALAASIGIRACGMGFDLGASCGVTYPPLHVAAACHLEISLPWPLPDPTLDFNVSLP